MYIYVYTYIIYVYILVIEIDLKRQRVIFHYIPSFAGKTHPISPDGFSMLTSCHLKAQHKTGSSPATAAILGRFVLFSKMFLCSVGACL